MRVNKFQQFHFETFVDHELTDQRVSDDHFQFLLPTAESRVCHPHTIDSEGHFSWWRHSWSSYGSILLLG